jgi:hypothetical protein
MHRRHATIEKEITMICNAILEPIVTIVRTLIQVARQIVRTVCDWVSSTITVIKEVVEKVCSWLPWPLSELCKWVTKLIEVVETVWNWVCHDVIETIFEWVEIITEYVIYVLKWVCWVIDWVVRLPGLLLCFVGIKPRKFIRVCVKVLADRTGNPAIPINDVRAMMRDAATIFRRCNVELVVCSLEVVIKPEFLTSTTCDVSGMFSRFFTWFSSNGCGCCSMVTVYFVQDIAAASGCAYPGTDWVTVDAQGDGTVVVQEIGHLCELWAHSSDPNNVMTDQPGGTHDQVTETQCCMIRTSRFASFHPPCGPLRLGKAGIEEFLEHSAGMPHERKERGRHID